MDIVEIANARNEATRIVDLLAGQSANKEPFAWDKLDRIRTYLKKSTVQECDDYFNPLGAF